MLGEQDCIVGISGFTQRLRPAALTDRLDALVEIIHPIAKLSTVVRRY
ncbi:MAG: hypothetical protein V3U65_10480 [Granulosicoccaceae bacterium]